MNTNRMKLMPEDLEKVVGGTFTLNDYWQHEYEAAGAATETGRPGNPGRNQTAPCPNGRGAVVCLRRPRIHSAATISDTATRAASPLIRIRPPSAVRQWRKPPRLDA